MTRRSDQEKFDRFTELAARVLGVPIVSLALVGPCHGVVTSSTGLSPALVLLLAHRFSRDARGRTLGTLCAMDTRPRAWSREQLERLYDVAWALEHGVDWRAPKGPGAEPRKWRRAAPSRSTLPSHG